MSEIINISVEDLAEKQDPDFLKKVNFNRIGWVYFLDGGRGEKIGGIRTYEPQMKVHIKNNNFVVIPIQFHEENKNVVAVSIADSFSFEELPEAVISVEKFVAKGILEPGAKRFNKSLLKKTIAKLRLDLRSIISENIGLKYCEDPNANVSILKKLVPHPHGMHAARYAKNVNPHIDFLNMFKDNDICSFAYWYSLNKHASTNQFKDMLEYIDGRMPGAINDFACGYAERSAMSEDLLDAILKNPNLDIIRLLNHVRGYNKLNNALVDRLNKWSVFL